VGRPQAVPDGKPGHRCRRPMGRAHRVLCARNGNRFQGLMSDAFWTTLITMVIAPVVLLIVQDLLARRKTNAIASSAVAKIADPDNQITDPHDAVVSAIIEAELSNVTRVTRKVRDTIQPNGAKQ
jgi:hypothetical protein